MNNLRGIYIVIFAIVVAISLQTYVLVRFTSDFARETRAGALETEKLYSRLVESSKRVGKLEQLVRSLEQELTGSQANFDNYVTKEKQANTLAAASAKLAVLSTELKLANLERGTQSVVNAWTNRVARLTCTFAGYTQSGSGTLFQSSDGVSVTVVTNKHVVVGAGSAIASSCRVNLPELGKEYSIKKGDDISMADDVDIAMFNIAGVDQSVRALLSPASAICGAKSAVGSKVVVMGFPIVGSNVGITVTEGIISGYDGDQYYTTSAKVEQGNSGGAVVAVDKNCFVGIPTFVQYGSLESLARILDIRNITI